MTLSLDETASANLFKESSRIRIADLRPDGTALNGAHIDAQVALIWPYSSSTRRLSLLLVETDVPLHSAKRQVKITFHDGAARTTQESRVGIGDKVKLGVTGCDWTRPEDVISTPGKKLDWDLEFRDTVELKIDRPNELSRVVQYISKDTSHLSNDLNHSALRNETGSQPVTSNITLPLVTPLKGRLTSSINFFLDASPDFGEDGDSETGRARKRTKFARHSGRWQLATPDQNGESQQEILKDSVQQQEVNERKVEQNNVTPELATVENNESTLSLIDDTGEEPVIIVQQDIPTVTELPPTELINEVIVTDRSLDGKDSVEVMKPPQFPPKRRQSAGLHINLDRRNESLQTARATTPRLLPLASPGLPLVSPLVKKLGIESGYFPTTATQASELDALADSTKAVREVTSTYEGDASNMSIASEDSLVVLGEKHVSHFQALGEDRQDLLQIGVNINNQAMEHEYDTGVPNFDPTVLDTFPEPPSAVSSISFSQSFSTVGPFATGQNKEDKPNTTFEIIKEAVVEDEDMYGPPLTSETKPIQRQPTVDEPRSALDVVSEFLDMSPTIPDFPPIAPQRNISPVVNDQQTSNQSHGSPVWQTKLEVTAVECESEGQYSPPPFPFQQGWHRRDSQRSSRRSSAHTSANHSLDGTLDEQNTEQPGPSFAGVGAEQVHPVEKLIIDSETIPSLAYQQEVSLLGEANISTSKASASPMQSEHAELDETASDEDDIESTRSDSSESTSEVMVDEPLRLVQPHLFTPAHTQDDPDQVRSGRDEEPGQPTLPEKSLLPTPANTQDEPANQIQQLVPSAEPLFVDVGNNDDHAVSPIEQPEPRQIRRTSPRLSRKSMEYNSMNNIFVIQRPSDPLSILQSLGQKENIPFSSPIRSEAETHSVEKSSPIADASPEVADETTYLQEKAEAPNEVESNGQHVTEELQSINNHHGTTTALSYYPHLASLEEYFGKLVDIIAVCAVNSTDAVRAKKGPKDYYTIIRLADSSLGMERPPTTNVEVYRPVQSALPVTKRGDVIILHNFKVQSVKHKYALISTDTSAWAVFKAVKDFNAVYPGKPFINGPPLEYGDGEISEAKKLGLWWMTEGNLRYPQPEQDNTQNGTSEQFQEPASPKIAFKGREGLRSSTRTRRQENMTDNINNNDDTTAVTDDNESQLASSPLTSTFPRNKRSATPRTNGTKKADTPDTPHRRTRSQRSESVMHELRDGRKYGDDVVNENRRSKRGGSVVHELRDGATYVDE